MNPSDNRATPELSGPGTGTAGPAQLEGPHDTQPSRWRWLWPKIDGLATAERALKYGYIAALFWAGVIVVLILLRPDRYLPSEKMIMHAALFCIVAWKMRQRASRVAACIGLGVYLILIDRWFTWSTTGFGILGNSIFVLLTLYFVHGVRGAFAVYRYRAGAGGDGLQYQQVSALRRMIVIFLYLLIAFVLFGIVSRATSSCIDIHQCSPGKKLWSGTLALIWVGIQVWLIVSGWRGRLWGARRRQRSDPLEPGPHAA